MRWFVWLGRSRYSAIPLLTLLAATSPGAARAEAADTQTTKAAVPLLLSVVINDRPIGLVGDFRQVDGKLYAKPSELDAIGFRIKLASGNTEEVPLASLTGVSYRLDVATQTVYFTASNAALKPSQLSAAPAANELPVESGLGAVVNYNLVGSIQGGHTVSEGLVDGRVFTPWGVAASSFLGVTGVSNIRPILRLDTNFVYSDPDTLRRYRVGDVISGGLAWSRPVRLGGIQITTDFSIRPDLVTFPVPTIGGTVAVPSSVDVLLNGVQYLSRDVPPGPFELRQLPVVSGVGDVAVVVRNAVGQETTQHLPIYVSNLLLAPGLSSFSGELGALRLNYGTRSDDYRAPAGAFTYRYGLFDWLTLEAHGEGSGPGSGAIAGSGGSAKAATGGMAGGGAAFTLGRFGVLALSGATSHYAGHSGQLLSASYERITPVFSLTGSIIAAGHAFEDIAAAAGDAVPLLQARVSAGLAMGEYGSVGVAFVGVRRKASGQSQTLPAYQQQSANAPYSYELLPLRPASKVLLVSASYSRQIFSERAFFYATAFRDFASSSSYGLMAGITIPLGKRTSVSSGVNAGNSGTGGTFQASQPANEVGDFGWRVQADTDHPTRQLANAAYRAPWSLVEADLDRTGGHNAFRASAQGAIATAGGGVFATNTINDSFAVVDTGEPGIDVLQENRPVGQTGSSGLLFVPGLRSFDANRIGIDPTNVPLDADIGETTRMVRPQDRSGVIVHFPVRASQGAVIRLTDAAGAPLAVGSTAHLASGSVVTVGYGGEIYVTGLHPHEQVSVTLPSGSHCSAAFDYSPEEGALPYIGPVTCKPSA